MTVKNAEYYGYKVGNKFKFKEGVSDDERNENFIESEILELIRDDFSSCPLFKDEHGKEDYEDLHLLEKIATERTLKPQDLGCWQQVVGVIGEDRASEELQKVIDIKESEVLWDERGELFEAFHWEYTPQGYSFWAMIEEGKSPYTEEIIPVATENVPSVAAMILAADDLTTESSVENIQSLLGTAYAEDISVYITVDSVKVYWKHYEFVVDNKVSLGKIIECIDVLEGQLVGD